MGLKIDSSFLRFLRMGALGVHRVQELMRQRGLEPIELERACGNSKIWMTKVKRLRVADLLCVRTGLRVEVRAKSNLAIKMSDAPGNPDRRWNSGLAGDDMIAFVKIFDQNGNLIAAPSAEFFWVRDLAATEAASKLGPAKSASEGAERDREWPSIVPKSNGQVIGIDGDTLRTRLVTGRNQTYRLNGKHAYARRGDEFAGEAQFIAGLPVNKANLPALTSTRWDPRPLLDSETALDRYVAAKALGRIGTPADAERLLELAAQDGDTRVRLEAAGSLLRLGRPEGFESIEAMINNPQPEFLRMESVLILSELRETPLAARCVEILGDVATNADMAEDEVRQAAIWGLGKAGHRDYGRLLGFLEQDDIEERVHGVNAFGADTDNQVIRQLVDVLSDQDATDAKKASASYILTRIVPPDRSVPPLREKYQIHSNDGKEWLVATLGQVRGLDTAVFADDPVLRAQLETLQRLSPASNWTQGEGVVDKIAFVANQGM